MFHGVVGDRQGSHGFMFEEEAIVRFLMALKMDRDIPSQIRAMCHGHLTIIVVGEDNDACAARGRVEIDTVGTTTMVGCLQDEVMWVSQRWVDAGT
jgi:hypothetical protein